MTDIAPVLARLRSHSSDNYGTREDGTPKGGGFFGPLQRRDNSGKVSTELSIGAGINGKETLLPLLVPTLKPEEVNYLLTNSPNPHNIPSSIKQKAVTHAIQRIKQGQSPFASAVETAAAIPIAEYGPTSR